MTSRGGILAPEVNRVLFVKNLSYAVTSEELFKLFGQFGRLRQIRQGIATENKGSAYVVYEDVMDAKSACEQLNGFNFQQRYLVVLYHKIRHQIIKEDDDSDRRESLEAFKRENGYD